MAIKLTRRRIAALLAGLAAGAGLGKSAAAQDSGGDMPAASTGIEPIMPSPPPPFHFTDRAGKALTLGDFKGQGLVVNFWATWCGPCVAELPTLAALSPKLSPDDIRVLAISVDMTGPAVVLPFFAAHHIDGLTPLFDESSSALDAFGTSGIPLTVILDRQGRVVAKLEGGADWNNPSTASMIRQLVGKPEVNMPAAPQVKAI